MQLSQADPDGNSSPKEFSVIIIYHKTITNIIAKNQILFRNSGLRWVFPQHLIWLELWVDYKHIINPQNYVAPL